MFNPLPFNINICWNDKKDSKPAFKEYIHAHFFYCEREFTSIYKKCTQFLASAAMYTRSVLLYSMLRNITVERRPQKRTFSSNRLWFDILLEMGYINFVKIYGLVHVQLLVVCCICNMTSFASLTFVPPTIYGLCINDHYTLRNNP